jgi:hypothetical protein
MVNHRRMTVFTTGQALFFGTFHPLTQRSALGIGILFQTLFLKTIPLVAVPTMTPQVFR